MFLVLDGILLYYLHLTHNMELIYKFKSRFCLRKETEPSFRNVVFWGKNRTVFLDKDKTMDNVQEHSNHKVLTADTYRGLDFCIGDGEFSAKIIHTHGYEVEQLQGKLHWLLYS
jgi:hypothetical protein